ncbi:MAG: single-stranded DNA-binding protein [Bacteroidetes bacterium]|nr:MAG: single-stranded DNA-binding protein [Bacteroidota bacterium]
MAGINKVILVGNLGKDPEVRTLENGAKVANFTLATSETYKNKEGQRVTTTEWHNIVLWRGLADIAERFLRKGNQVYIEGKIKSRTWDDKDGNKRYITEILGDNLTMLGSKRDSDNSDSAPAPIENTAPDTKAGDEKDDLPF